MYHRIILVTQKVNLNTDLCWRFLLVSIWFTGNITPWKLCYLMQLNLSIRCWCCRTEVRASRPNFLPRKTLIFTVDGKDVHVRIHDENELQQGHIQTRAHTDCARCGLYTVEVCILAHVVRRTNYFRVKKGCDTCEDSILLNVIILLDKSLPHLEP
jgi:Pyruvate/2-oxoacid:ferredoxin oxidoreductase delta subunit